MRSISSAIISFVIFYIGLCLPKDERKQCIIRGGIFCLSDVMLIVSLILMVLGLWWNDDFRLRKVKYMEFYPTNEYREVTLQAGLNSVQLGNTDKLFSDGLEEDEYIYFDDSKGFCYEDGCVIGGTYDQTLKVLYSQWGFDHKFYVKRTEAKKIKLELTQEEISILSNGLICLIDNAYKAEKLTCETSIIKALDESVKIYQKLNQKICNSVSKMEW